MIEYAKRKHGADKVVQIGTFGTMIWPGSVRDTARALGFAYTIGDRIAKLIPMGAQGFPMTIDRAMAEVPELTELYKKMLTQKNNRHGQKNRRLRQTYECSRRCCNCSHTHY